jgi:hypothetical protein
MHKTPGLRLPPLLSLILVLNYYFKLKHKHHHQHCFCIFIIAAFVFRWSFTSLNASFCPRDRSLNYPGAAFVDFLDGCVVSSLTATMTSFMSNFFQSGKDKAALDSARPSTPTRNANNGFINPVQTPHGSPSKKAAPPGAYDLPEAFESSLSLASTAVETPIQLTRPQNLVSPLSPTKTNALPHDDSTLSVDESIIHKTNTQGNHLKRQGQENTPPVQLNHAAVSRQQHYEPKERPLTQAKKFNTSRGLTAEEMEILQRPSIRRLTNVTQLCELTCLKC